MTPTRFDTCLISARRLQEAGASDEELLGALRAHGASMFESARLVRRIKPISLKEAQEMILLSATWRDQGDDEDDLKEAFSRSLRENT
jgi:hypothetical protein